MYKFNLAAYTFWVILWVWQDSKRIRHTWFATVRYTHSSFLGQQLAKSLLVAVNSQTLVSNYADRVQC